MKRTALASRHSERIVKTFTPIGEVRFLICAGTLVRGLQYPSEERAISALAKLWCPARSEAV
jgi:hypothetical protein